MMPIHDNRILQLLSTDVMLLVLGQLDVRDLVRLDAADPAFFSPAIGSAGAVFEHVARRVLADAEIAWFERHGLRVRLLEECKITADAEGDDASECKREWFRNGERHREGDLPAVVWGNGQRGSHHQSWFFNGKLHREGDLPAVVFADGRQQWNRHGKLHREGDMPAVVRANHQSWYRDGERHREGDLPAVVFADGRQSWYRHGKLHREGDLPAVVWADRQFQAWYFNGERHREGGRPAILDSESRPEWFRNGKRHREGCTCTN